MRRVQLNTGHYTVTTMGKINKHSNLYSKDGELLRQAPIKDYTIAELEELVDKLKAELDESSDKPSQDPTGYNNAMLILTQLYQKNPKAQLEFLQKLQQHYTTNVEVKEALNDILD